MTIANKWDCLGANCSINTLFYYLAVHNNFFFLKILPLNLPLYENMLIFFQTFTIFSESLCTVKGDFKDQQKKESKFLFK